MATTEAMQAADDDLRDDDFQYRALSSGAMASLVFGLLSGLVFLAGRDSLQASLMICPIPVIGIVVGLKSLARIRSMPDSLSGAKLAIAGVLFSCIGLVAGLGYSGYVYATEVPEGYVRISFQTLRPDAVEIRGGRLVPQSLLELDGKKVFIKGFMRADSTPRRHNVRGFLLVRDNNQCCFGDLSKVKYYDQVLVKMGSSARADYSTGVFRMGGTLHINPDNARKGPGYPVFSLDADYVE